MGRLGWLALSLICSCASAQRVGEREELPAPLSRWVDAFNRHDIEAMLSEVTPDFEWFMVDGATLSLETSGAAALRESMRSYFEKFPTARSTIEASMTSGSFVSLRERASWQSKGEARSQASVAVYELNGGKLRRAWYFPAEK
jgi:hypothetical protein